MEFNKGSELDKQIYPEGESTWGCKSGVLDVEDVKEFIAKMKKIIIDTNKERGIKTIGFAQIDKLAGKDLI